VRWVSGRLRQGVAAVAGVRGQLVLVGGFLVAEEVALAFVVVAVVVVGAVDAVHIDANLLRQ
jgi:hypothetical protein